MGDIESRQCEQERRLWINEESGHDEGKAKPVETAVVNTDKAVGLRLTLPVS
ncbi:hypothetical protein Pmar_PMAR012376 [Perkinsus marinus ATCC 50983]|uniref:Uncharacterized protein n=1 Tax=Perkinsus marinus (strain ATCC 50983 / TXsc) TaxID=423536 RepID=C5K764_PERM5|nr:hypothetical protein Pmar_PMAR012376 [Perkinsus marinus ATCC 50983]EER19399.1 hypothetical protein Pmar_PMAR012376 [Perkinsus marinus ATCC 50983]|eukprot:XP_002787603.1 hypothetical protein Pmar_PMAR012376 [Perkinsus marinus ATCC 50983]